MASLSSTGSVTSSNSLGNTSLRGFGGMVSGIQRDEIIEAMTLHTTNKITNQKSEITKLQWKQEAYRGLSDNILDATPAGWYSFGVTVAGESGKYNGMTFEQSVQVFKGSTNRPANTWEVVPAIGNWLAGEGDGVRITGATLGKVVDFGITDVNNMGAAMAPAAYDTLAAHFAATGTGPQDYDLVITGDLGMLGHQIVTDLFARDGVDMSQNYQDCGMLLYDIQKQDMHAGASGCGCAASVLCGYLLRQMEANHLKKILFAPTGALLSPTSSFQGESIPSICHALTIEK